MTTNVDVGLQSVLDNIQVIAASGGWLELSLSSPGPVS